MATANVQDNDDKNSLECPICSETFKDPRILPCGRHILCHDCIVSWIKKNPSATCPLCRITFQDSPIQGKCCSKLYNFRLKQAIQNY